MFYLLTNEAYESLISLSNQSIVRSSKVPGRESHR